MSAKTRNSLRGSAYPLSVSLFMIIIAVLLSFVDLTFLTDVIGKVLDFGTLESTLIAFSLGLVGIFIMAHVGLKVAHGADKKRNLFGHYALWILLGIAFVTIRLFSASIMHLDALLGDSSLINVMGLNVREIDLVLAPLMFFLFIATGLIVKDGVKNLLLNPEFETKLASWRETRLAKKNEENLRRSEAEKRHLKQRSEVEKLKRQRESELEADRLKLKLANEDGRVKNALNGNYSNALAQFRGKEKEIKSKYQKISANIDFIKNIDKQEKEFEINVKPSLLSIVDAAILSIQNNTALAIRNKTGDDINSLRTAIDTYNNRRHE